MDDGILENTWITIATAFLIVLALRTVVEFWKRNHGRGSRRR